MKYLSTRPTQGPEGCNKVSDGYIGESRGCDKGRMAVKENREAVARGPGSGKGGRQQGRSGSCKRGETRW